MTSKNDTMSISIQKSEFFFSRMHVDYQKVNFLINNKNSKYPARTSLTCFFSTNKTIFQKHKVFNFLWKNYGFSENDLYFTYLLNYSLEVLIV